MADKQKKAFLAGIKKWAQLGYKPELYKGSFVDCQLCAIACDCHMRYCLIKTARGCCDGYYGIYSNTGKQADAKNVHRFIIARYKEERNKED